MRHGSSDPPPHVPAASEAGPPLHRDPWLWTLCGLALAQLSFLAPRLLYPDLELSYPFPGGDGYDWIANGLFFTGADVRWSGRPPLVPLLLAGLEHLSLLRWYPVLSLLAFHGAALAAYPLAAPAWGRTPAAAVTTALLLNATAQHNALLVMADLPAAFLLMLAVLAFLAAREHPRLYALAGLLAGLSAVTQQTALLVPIVVTGTVLVTRRDHLRRRGELQALAVGALGFVAPVGAWFVFKRVAAGRWADTGTRHWELLAPHLDSVDFYGAAALSLLGWPGVLLTAGGVAVLARRLRPGFRPRLRPGSGDELRGPIEDRSLFVLLLLAAVLGFFVFFYDWEAERFLLYALFPAALPMAAALARLPRGAAIAAGAMLVVWSAWPQPRPELANRWTVWPVPTIQTVRTGSGDGWSLERLPLGRLPALTTIGRVRAARDRLAPPAGSGSAVPDPARFSPFRSAVFLDDGTLDATRYVTATRLGNVLRRRVKVVSSGLYPPRWWGWRGTDTVATFDRYRLFGVALEGLEERYLVAVARGGPTEAALLERPEPLPPPGEATLRHGARLARKIDARTVLPEGVLAVFPEHRETVWYQLLPFVSRTTNLFLLDAAEARSVAAGLEDGRVLERTMEDGISLVHAEIGGRRVQVVPPPGGAAMMQ